MAILITVILVVSFGGVIGAVMSAHSRQHGSTLTRDITNGFRK